MPTAPVSSLALSVRRVAVRELESRRKTLAVGAVLSAAMKPRWAAVTAPTERSNAPFNLAVNSIARDRSVKTGDGTRTAVPTGVLLMAAIVEPGR